MFCFVHLQQPHSVMGQHKDAQTVVDPNAWLIITMSQSCCCYEGATDGVFLMLNKLLVNEQMVSAC